MFTTNLAYAQHVCQTVEEANPHLKANSVGLNDTLYAVTFQQYARDLDDSTVCINRIEKEYRAYLHFIL